jgi:hypothetical protein
MEQADNPSTLSSPSRFYFGDFCQHARIIDPEAKLAIMLAEYCLGTSFSALEYLMIYRL